MKWSEIGAGALKAAEQKFWAALGDKADVVVRSINNDPGYLTRLAAWAIQPPFADKMLTSLNPQWLRAREIMGKNFFGVEEAMEHLEIIPTGADFGVLAEIPFAESVLESCKDTHILVAVFPLSLLDLRSACKDLVCGEAWYKNMGFAKKKGKVGWHLVCKTPVDGSMEKAWDEQKGLLSKGDKVPSVRVVAYTMVGHYMSTGERLFEKVWVRCSDVDSGGYRVNVGEFDGGGLVVSSYSGDGRDSDLGVSASRKPQVSNL